MSQAPGFRRPVTIADVANAAGVSRMTVSKVLRGTGRISAATRARVSLIAEEMGYIPNSLAGALSSQTSRLVGVLIPSISEEVYAGVLAGINAVLHPKGFTALIGETFFDAETETRLVRMTLSMKPAGMILTGGLQRSEATLRLLGQSGVRSVQIWDGDRPALDATAGLSHAAAGRIAARAFLAAGLRRTCYIGAELQRDLCAAQRMEGFAAELRGSGAECRLVTDPELPRTTEGGQVLTERLLCDGTPPEAIHYLNDAMAVGGLRCLLAAGIDVPGQISVIGFNGTSLRHAIRTRLTTIEVPLTEIGRHAAAAAISPAPAGGSLEVALFETRLIPGSTVRAAAP